MRISLLIYIVLFSFNLINAQSLIVTGNTYFTGSSLDQITHHLDVKNVANKSITVVCQKTYLSSPSALPMWAGASYCFAGNCYASSSTFTSSSSLLNSGQSISYAINDQDAFSGYYDPAETPGISTVEYCFYDEINPTDRTCVVITYDVGSASALNEINKMISDFYPNPAQDVINFEYLSNRKAELRIIDVLGDQVKSLVLSEPGTQKINISDLAQGIYFGNLMINDEIITIKKIVIK